VSTEEGREQSARERILRAVLELLEAEGVSALTTRRVGDLARVPAPTIYRLFGDKQGLIEAAVERGYEDWIGAKRALPPAKDPVEALRLGWDDAVAFALQHPALYRLAQARQPAALNVGHALLADKVHQAALVGRLQLSEEDAIALLRAAGRGAILELLDTPAHDRNPRASALMRDSILDAIVITRPHKNGHGVDISSAAVMLAAAAPGTPGFSTVESHLLAEWLTRLAKTHRQATGNHTRAPRPTLP